jgi:hypothetical protein
LAFAQVRATPTVPHPKLPLLFSLVKTGKTLPSSSAVHPSVSEEVEWYKNNFVFSQFQEEG